MTLKDKTDKKEGKNIKKHVPKWMLQDIPVDERLLIKINRTKRK